MAPAQSSTRLSLPRGRRRGSLSQELAIRESSKDAFLSVHGKDILTLNNAQREDILGMQSLLYQNGEISIINDKTLASGIPNFYFYDSLQFYRFEAEILEGLVPSTSTWQQTRVYTQPIPA